LRCPAYRAVRVAARGSVRQRFPELSATNRDVFFAAFLAAALSTVLLIAASSYHRLRWRQHEISWHRFEPGRALPPSGAFQCVLG
jgi:hypothetical protein